MLRSRRHRGPLLTAALTAIVLVISAGAALAYRAAPAGTARGSGFTADTPAPCNAPQPAGRARCLAVIRTPADHQILAATAGPPGTALGPAQIQAAYRLPATGGGQTVAVVDAYGDSAAESNLAYFRSHYGLPACTTGNGCFSKVNQKGKQGSYPRNDTGWALETSLDLDAVSSACPKCDILLVESDTTSLSNMGAAEDEAVRLGARFISNSYGMSEAADELAFDRYYDHPGVAVVAGAGDSGYGTMWPAASRYVTAVGGTTLTRAASVARGWRETVWGSATGELGTGSGCSRYEPKPADQDGVTTDCAKRAMNDIAADANPASGLAVYDTLGYRGWLQVGGTSLASPLIAAAYALGGVPVPGTYPVSYPYHDPHQSADLFDITQGVNGDCGTLLCRAGKGWDGPTGLGTPDGVAALTSGPQAQITGRVISKATGQPLAGVTVSAEPGDYATRTSQNGDYSMDVAAGRYNLAAADFGYRTASQAGVRVGAGKTAAASFALVKQAAGTLSGTVTDGSGHGWPLPGQIVVSGYPGGPVWASPVTGRYSVRLPQGHYTLSVTAAYPGYRGRQVPVTVGADTTENLTLSANPATCTAPGYGWDGLSQDFTGWTGGTSRDGWTVSNGGPGQPGWRFDNPGDRPPPPHASGRPLPGWPQEFTAFDSDDFAVADAGFYAPRALDTGLTSPPVSLAGQASPEIAFDSAYYPAAGRQAASVQVSTDGGGSWTTVWHQETSDALGPVTIAIPQAAGKTRAEARFSFAGSGGGYWAVGNVLIGTARCVPQTGGLLVGAVTSRASGRPVDGAQIATSATPQPQAWPAGISLASSDSALPGGFYWLSAPAGGQRATATAAGFATASAEVTVTANQVTSHDWALAPAAGG